MNLTVIPFLRGIAAEWVPGVMGVGIEPLLQWSTGKQVQLTTPRLLHLTLLLLAFAKVAAKQKGIKHVKFEQNRTILLSKKLVYLIHIHSLLDFDLHLLFARTKKIVYSCIWNLAKNSNHGANPQTLRKLRSLKAFLLWKPIKHHLVIKWRWHPVITPEGNCQVFRAGTNKAIGSVVSV